MQLPQININGTARSDLLEQYLTAKRALDHAIEALAEAYPHGRDYQTLPHGAHQQAMNEHADRMRRLRTIRAEVETLAEAVV